MIEGISHAKLRNYIATRDKIDSELKKIYSLSHILSLFDKNTIDSDLKLDPIALGYIHNHINTCALNIWEILDDFIYIVHAQSEVERIEN